MAVEELRAEVEELEHKEELKTELGRSEARLTLSWMPVGGHGRTPAPRR